MLTLATTTEPSVDTSAVLPGLRWALSRDIKLALRSRAELGVQPLAECSIVVAPYVIEGEALGTIGVLGPTRMNYPQAMAAVAIVSERLGRTLSA